MRFIPTLIAAFVAAGIANVSVAQTLPNYSVLQSEPDSVSVRNHFFATGKMSSAALTASAYSVVKPSERNHVAARNYLKQLLRQQGMNELMADAASLRHMHDTGRGAIVARFRQQLNGLDVMGAETALIMNRHHQLVASSGNLSNAVDRYAKMQRAANKTISDDFAVTESAVITSAFEQLGGKQLQLQAKKSSSKGRKQFSGIAHADYQLQRANSERVYFRQGDNVIPAYRVEMWAGKKNSKDADVYGFVFSAKDGRLLLRKNLKQNESFGYRVYADNSGIKMPWDGPQGRAGHPHPTGLANSNYMPAMQSPQMVVLEKGPISTNDPWLANGATITRGNNVDAYVDQGGNDGFDGGDLRGTVNTTVPGTGEAAFDYTLNPDLPANANDAQKKAAAVSMFYMVNWLHDWFYDHGFNEAAGNAQFDNYGRGGMAGDRLLAEAQDSSGSNNANMATPSDGSEPTMQMYVWFNEGDSEVNVGAPLSTNYMAQPSSFGPQTFVSVTRDLVLASDGTAPINDGCQAFTNAASLSGKIVLIERGTCNFTAKVKSAQTAGALGVVIYNNTAAGLPPMGGTDDTVTIPSVGVSQANGNSLKTALNGGAVSVTLNEPKPYRDSSFDALIVAHEWGHFITNRMIGDAFGLNNNQGASMGEGWGDFHALLMTAEANDLTATPDGWDAKWALGGYSSQGRLANDTYFSGIRGWPYTTDMDATNGNPLTFSHVETDPAVHGSGTFWATVLWDCYVSLLKAYAFSDAQNRMKDYLVASYAATPNSPTFTEARDALLAVVRAADPADYTRFITAFARRGLGAGAQSPERYNAAHVGVVESYESNAFALIDNISMIITNDADNDGVLDVGDQADLHFDVASGGFLALNNLSVSLSSAKISAGTPVNFGALAVGESRSGMIHFTLNNASFNDTLSLQLTAVDNAMTGDVTKTFVRSVNYDLTRSLSLDTVSKSFITDWVTGIAIGDDSAKVVVESDSANSYYSIPDNGFLSDVRFVSPVLTVGASDQLVVSWKQAYKFEESEGPGYWDGGVVEYSTDGNVWTDASSKLATGYNNALTLNDNPLGTRRAYTGMSSGYPAMISETLNLSGLGLNGQNVRIRFRVGTDSNTGDSGWRIDDISVSGITNSPFSSLSVNGSAGAAPTAATVSPLNADYTLSGGRVTIPVSWNVATASFVTNAQLLVNGSAVDMVAITPTSSAVTQTFNYSAMAAGNYSFVVRLCNGGSCADSAAVSTSVKAASSGGGGGGGSFGWLSLLLGLALVNRRKY